MADGGLLTTLGLSDAPGALVRGTPTIRNAINAVTIGSPESPAAPQPQDPVRAQTAAYGVDPNQANAEAIRNAQAAGLPTPDQATALHRVGVIDADTHAAIHDAWGLGNAQAALGRNAKQVGAENQAYNQTIAQNTEQKASDIQSQADLDIQKAKEQATYDAERQKQMAEYEKQQAQEQADMQSRYNDKRGELDRMVQQASTAHIDPEAARGGIGQRMVAGIATALGAMGSTYAGGPNIAAQIIQKQIEDNLQAQKDEIANKWRGVEAGRNDLSDIRDQIKDHGASDQLFRAREAQKAQDYIRSLDLKNAPAQTQLAANQALTNLSQSASAATHDATLKALEYDRTNRVQQADIGAKRGELAMNQERLNLEKVKAGEKEVPAEARDTADLIRQVDDLTKLKGYSLPGTEKSHEAEAKLSTLQAGLRTHFKISERHPEMIKDILGADITGVRGGKAETQLKTLRKQLVEELKVKHGIDLGSEPGAERPSGAGAPI